MTCQACAKRQAARSRGGEYHLGGIVDGVKVPPCPQCLISHDAYTFKGRKPAIPAKGKK